MFVFVTCSLFCCCFAVSWFVILYTSPLHYHITVLCFLVRYTVYLPCSLSYHYAMFLVSLYCIPPLFTIISLCYVSCFVVLYTSPLHYHITMPQSTEEFKTKFNEKLTEILGKKWSSSKHLTKDKYKWITKSTSDLALDPTHLVRTQKTTWERGFMGILCFDLCSCINNYFLGAH